MLLSISSTTLDKKNGINEDFEFEFAHILDFFLKKIVLFIYWHSNGWDWGEEESVFFLLFSFENVCRNKKSFYICTRNTEVVHDLLEKWQSGRMRQSWKLLTVTGPGVRIPLSPRNSLSKVIKTSKILGISRFFVFTTFQNIHSFSKIKRPHRDPN